MLIFCIGETDSEIAAFRELTDRARNVHNLKDFLDLVEPPYVSSDGNRKHLALFREFLVSVDSQITDGNFMELHKECESNSFRRRLE